MSGYVGRPTANSVNFDRTTVVFTTASPNKPTLTNPVVANGRFQFLLPTQTGYSDQVQSETNLSDAVWTLEQTIPGDGAVKRVTVEATAAQNWVQVMAQYGSAHLSIAVCRPTSRVDRSLDKCKQVTGRRRAVAEFFTAVPRRRA